MFPQPTIAHYFIKLLNEKGILLRDYTQVSLTCIFMDEGWLQAVIIAINSNKYKLVTGKVFPLRIKESICKLII